MGKITDGESNTSGSITTFPSASKVITVPATKAVQVLVDGVEDVDLGVTATTGKTGHYQVRVDYFED